MLLTGNLLQTSVLFSEMTYLGTPLSDRSSEQALISDILGGNTAGFESLIGTYQGRVFATARKYARKESEVEDIVQEIFIKRISTYWKYAERMKPMHAIKGKQPKLSSTTFWTP